MHSMLAAQKIDVYSFILNQMGLFGRGKIEWIEHPTVANSVHGMDKMTTAALLTFDVDAAGGLDGGGQVVVIGRAGDVCVHVAPAQEPTTLYGCALLDLSFF